MDTLRHIKPATLQQAFDLRPINDALIEKLPGDNKYIPTPGKAKIYSNSLQTQMNMFTNLYRSQYAGN